RPDFLIDGPGESAALVAKKFRFEQAGGNGSAVDLDESAVAARAAIVDGACKEFFAGSRFAEEQHGRSRGSGEFHLREGAFPSGARGSPRSSNGRIQRREQEAEGHWQWLAPKGRNPAEQWSLG